MSWDVTLIKTKSNNEEYDAIGDDDKIGISPLMAAEVLKLEFPEIDCSDSAWFVYETADFEAQISFSDEKEVTMYIHILRDYEEPIYKFIEKVCELFDCRAFDWAEVQFIGEKKTIHKETVPEKSQKKKRSFFEKLFKR